MFCKAKARVKKTGIVDPKLAHHRINWNHLGSPIRRYVYAFTRRKDIKLVRVQYQFFVIPNMNLLPKISGVVLGYLVNVDDARVLLSSVAHEASCMIFMQIDTQYQSVADSNVAVHQNGRLVLHEQVTIR